MRKQSPSIVVVVRVADTAQVTSRFVGGLNLIIKHIIYMKKYFGFTTLFSLLVLSGLIALSPVLASADTTSAQGNPPTWANGQPGGRGMMSRDGSGVAGMMKPAIVGVVSAVNGNTLTVSGKAGFSFGPNKTAPATPATTTYSVDATNAKVTKANVASTVSAIAVSDTVMVQGTITGTNIVATIIRDGIMPERGMMNGKSEGGKIGQGQNFTSTITGNGQPIIAGIISNINSNTLTVTNKSNVTYTVDATNAKIAQGQNATATIASLKIGDNVVVQGTVIGTSVTASTIVDQPAPAANAGTPAKPHMGFFANIGQFFGHLFGF